MKKSLALSIAVLLSTFAINASALSSFQASKKPKPRIAVLELTTTDASLDVWWHEGGSRATQEAFVTELVKSNKFTVLPSKRVDAEFSKNSLDVSDGFDKETAVRVGKLLGVNYLLTGSVTEYGVTDKGAGSGIRSQNASAAVKASLINTSTGEVVWSKELRETAVGSFSGKADPRLFALVMKPCIQKLTASLKAADL